MLATFLAYLVMDLARQAMEVSCSFDDPEALKDYYWPLL